MCDEFVREAGLVRRRGRRLVATPAGRQATAGEPPDERAVSQAAPVYHLQLVGLLKQRHETGAGSKARLLPVGRATAIEAIRAHATAPRTPSPADAVPLADALVEAASSFDAFHSRV